MIVQFYDQPKFKVRTDLPKVGGRDQLELVEDCRYTLMSERGRFYLITIPKGYIFDGASIPRPLWWFAAPVSDWIAGALLHDWCYYTHPLTRLVADNLLRQIVRHEGHGEAYANAVYKSVRWFGRGSWTEGDNLAARAEIEGLGGSTQWRDPHWQAEDCSVLSDYPGAGV